MVNNNAELHINSSKERGKKRKNSRKKWQKYDEEVTLVTYAKSDK